MILIRLTHLSFGPDDKAGGSKQLGGNARIFATRYEPLYALAAVSQRGGLAQCFLLHGGTDTAREEIAKYGRDGWVASAPNDDWEACDDPIPDELWAAYAAWKLAQ